MAYKGADSYVIQTNVEQKQGTAESLCSSHTDAQLILS